MNVKNKDFAKSFFKIFVKNFLSKATVNFRKINLVKFTKNFKKIK